MADIPPQTKMGIASRVTLISIQSLLVLTLFVLTKDISNLVSDPIVFICIFLASFIFELMYNRFFNVMCNKEYNGKTASINAGLYVLAATFGYITYGTFIPESKTGVFWSILKSLVVLVPANLWYFYHNDLYTFECAPVSPPSL